MTQFLKLVNVLEPIFDRFHRSKKPLEEALELLDASDGRRALFSAHERILSRYCQEREISTKGWTGDFIELIDVFFHLENVVGIKSRFSVLNKNSDCLTWPSLILVDGLGNDCLGDYQITCCAGLQKPDAATLFAVEASVSQRDEYWPIPSSNGWEYATRFTIFEDFSEDLLGDIRRYTSSSEEWTETEIADVLILRLSLAYFGSRVDQLALRLLPRLRSRIRERLADHAKKKYSWKTNVSLTRLEQKTLRNQLRAMHETLGTR